MNCIENIHDFYNMPQNKHLLNIGDHEINENFNIFRRWDDCKSVQSFLRRDFYRIVLTLNKGILTYPNFKIKVSEPTLFVANKITPYSWEATEYEQKGWVCLFTSEFVNLGNDYSLDQTFPILNMQAIPLFTLDSISLYEITELFEKIELEYKSDYLYKKSVLQNYLQLFLHQLQKRNMSVLDNRLTIDAAHRITFQFLELLEQQFPIKDIDAPLRLKGALDFSQRLSVHVNHLNHSVKKVTEKTSSQLIVNRIIIEARRMLLDTDWTIAQISYALGFEYPSYFTNFFKKHEGISPKQSRKK